MCLGENIRFLRTKKGYSQDDIANMLGYKSFTTKKLSYNTNEDNNIYYLDDDARDMAQFLYENPDYKVLFDASRKVKKEDIQFVKEMIDRMSNKND